MENFGEHPNCNFDYYFILASLCTYICRKQIYSGYILCTTIAIFSKMLKDEKIDYTSLGTTLFCLCTDGRTLKTCALRPAGIYGEGEIRHLPRIVVRYVKLILFYKQIQRPVGFAKEHNSTSNLFWFLQ